MTRGREGDFQLFLRLLMDAGRLGRLGRFGRFGRLGAPPGSDWSR